MQTFLRRVNTCEVLGVCPKVQVLMQVLVLVHNVLMLGEMSLMKKFAKKSEDVAKIIPIANTLSQVTLTVEWE